MYLIASVLVLAFTVYAYMVLRVGVLDPYPLPIFLLLSVSLVLAVVQIRVSSRLWLELLSVVPILLSGAFAFAVVSLAGYDEDRPLGPKVGETFPVQSLPRATDGRPIPVGAASAAGRLRLVVLFRGFW